MNTNQTNENAKAGDPLELEINGEKVIFRYCPPGTFLMGSPKDEQDRYDRELHPEKIEIIMCNGVLYDDEALHEVTLSRGFWLLETPVTEELWIAVKHSLVDSYSEGHQPDCPVTCVRWVDCAAFIDELNASGIAPSGMKFDFPTEAEWEYACRAGTLTAFNAGEELTEEDANFQNSCGPRPVRSYPPNAWGLYDMHGNVAEWCKDGPDEYWDYFVYPEGPPSAIIDPEGQTSDQFRVLRGGSWNYEAVGNGHCRSASRAFLESNAPLRGASYHVGFRLVLRSTERAG